MRQPAIPSRVSAVWPRLGKGQHQRASMWHMTWVGEVKMRCVYAEGRPFLNCPVGAPGSPTSGFEGPDRGCWTPHHYFHPLLSRVDEGRGSAQQHWYASAEGGLLRGYSANGDGSRYLAGRGFVAQRPHTATCIRDSTKGRPNKCFHDASSRRPALSSKKRV
jgi:hypothetical protein